MLRAAQPSNQNSIPGKGRRFFTSPTCQGGLWNTHSLLITRCGGRTRREKFITHRIYCHCSNEWSSTSTPPYIFKAYKGLKQNYEDKALILIVLGTASGSSWLLLSQRTQERQWHWDDFLRKKIWYFGLNFLFTAFFGCNFPPFGILDKCSSSCDFDFTQSENVDTPTPKSAATFRKISPFLIRLTASNFCSIVITKLFV
jgi:hypothetical protein